MSTALEGVIVLDVTKDFSASLSAAFLADFGATVIRLDFLGSVETASLRDTNTWDHEADLIHRNKKSMALDPATEKGRQLLDQLAAKADVILTDWMLHDLAELGLTYETLSKVNSKIIFGRISGFGPKGPDKDLPAIDELAAARSGQMPTMPQPGQPPVYSGAGAMHAMVMLAFGVVTALLHAQATGQGQEVDTSYFAANMYGSSLDIQAFLAIGEGDRFLNPISRLDVSNPMSGALYPTSDGKWVTVTMPDTDRWWPDLSAAMGLDEDDDRFNTHDKRCEDNRLALIDALEQGFKKKPGAHWRQVFEEKQMSADVIERFDYPAVDPQVLANKYVMDLDHPSFGKVQSLGFPIFMSESPARLSSLAPCKGQHTADVLHEVLGLSEDEIYGFTKDGVIA